MDVEDQVGGGTIGVGNLHEGRARAVGNERLSRSVVVSGEQDELRCCSVSVLVESAIKRSCLSYPALRMAVTAA